MSMIGWVLGGKEKHPIIVVIVVDKIIFGSGRESSWMARAAMDMMRRSIIEAILLDYPEEMEELKSMEELKL